MMGKRRKNRGQNKERKNGQFEKGDHIREDAVHKSEDDSLEDMDELVAENIEIKYTGIGK